MGTIQFLKTKNKQFKTTTYCNANPQCQRFKCQRLQNIPNLVQPPCIKLVHTIDQRSAVLGMPFTAPLQHLVFLWYHICQSYFLLRKYYMAKFLNLIMHFGFSFPRTCSNLPLFSNFQDYTKVLLKVNVVPTHFGKQESVFFTVYFLNK